MGRRVQKTARIREEEYESLKETVEILGDTELMKSVRKGLDDVRKGRTVPHAEVRRRLGN
jgi:PHD/YefM family antitoxin component YafN of YafNO toxin-antitoxin module